LETSHLIKDENQREFTRLNPNKDRSNKTTKREPNFTALGCAQEAGSDAEAENSKSFSYDLLERTQSAQRKAGHLAANCAN
jgi:hypothetical protein